MTVAEICFGKLPHSDMSWRGKWKPQQPVMNTSAEGLFTKYFFKQVILGMILLTMPYHILSCHASLHTTELISAFLSLNH